MGGRRVYGSGGGGGGGEMEEGWECGMDGEKEG